MSKIQKIKDFIIYKDHHYNTFPNAIKKKDGTIIVGFRQAPYWEKILRNAPNSNFGKTTHIDPSSKAVYVTSRDGGKTWDKETTVLYDDYVYGVQDPCLNLVNDDTILCTFFMWKVFRKEDVKEILPSDRIIKDKWIGRSDTSYSIRSFDGGKTWDEPIAIDFPGKISISVRGNASTLSDGSVVLPAYGNAKFGEPSKAILLRTKDFGKTWENLSVIASLDDYDLVEPNIYRTDSGKIVALIRAHKRGEKSVYDPGNVKLSPLITCESYDEGITWSKPVGQEIYSPSPFHALRLKSGNVMVTYGYRYKPFGLRAFILKGECDNFDEVEEVVLRDDGFTADIGYTSSVLLDNGDVLITYYYFDAEDEPRYIAGTVCREV